MFESPISRSADTQQQGKQHCLYTGHGNGGYVGRNLELTVKKTQQNMTLETNSRQKPELETEREREWEPTTEELMTEIMAP